MRILHTESSSGWGGQEIRILREAQGMRLRGHEIVMAVARGGGLVSKAREQGFTVYELCFKKSRALWTLPALLRILRRHKIDCVNTHSSMDAWMGGIAARLAHRRVVRTRHLSTPIRKGLNSRLLYGKLADYVATTSQGIVPVICSQATISPSLCASIPTGVDPSAVKVSPDEAKNFRSGLGIRPEEFLVGTACFVRSWKGVKDLMQAAALLKEVPGLRWVIIGGGYVEEYRGIAEALNLGDRLLFTGHLEDPLPAIASLDLFLLLSTAHEGVSQAALQAAYLERPLVTTAIGGLPEVCLPGKTGMIVPTFSPEEVAKAVVALKEDPERLRRYGKNAKQLVEEKFTFLHTLKRMEAVFANNLQNATSG